MDLKFFNLKLAILYFVNYLFRPHCLFLSLSPCLSLSSPFIPFFLLYLLSRPPCFSLFMIDFHSVFPNLFSFLVAPFSLSLFIHHITLNSLYSLFLYHRFACFLPFLTLKYESNFPLSYYEHSFFFLPTHPLQSFHSSSRSPTFNQCLTVIICIFYCIFERFLRNIIFLCICHT